MAVGGTVSPTADFTSSPSPSTAGSAVAFNASLSQPSTGATIVSYQWDFGDGSAPITTGTPNTSKTYAVAGGYTVTLTVTDSTGASASTSKTQTVN